jgi:hypothetical protein
MDDDLKLGGGSTVLILQHTQPKKNKQINNSTNQTPAWLQHFTNIKKSTW